MKTPLTLALILSLGLAVLLGLMLFKKQPPTVVVVTPAAATVVVTTAPPPMAATPAPAPVSPSRQAERKPVAVAIAAAAVAEEKVPLRTELPAPLFVGTPVPIPRLPNLEPRETNLGKRPEFFVPIGTTNLALGKVVTSSTPEPVLGELKLVTDGDKTGDDGSFVELMPGKQWVQIDLENEAELFAVWVWHFHSQSRVYLAVVAQISNDPGFTNGVTTIFNNDYANVQGFGVGTNYTYNDSFQGKLMDAKGVKGRYIRLYSAGNTVNKLNHYIEVEVFGRPLGANSGDGKKVSLKTELPAPPYQ